MRKGLDETEERKKEEREKEEERNVEENGEKSVKSPFEGRQVEEGGV